MGRPLPALRCALGAALRGSLVLLAAAAGIAAGGIAPSGAEAAVVPTAGPSRDTPTLTLLSQTPWVTPGGAMQLRLALGNQSRTDLTLGITVYQHLTSRSAFTETVNGTAVGVALATASVPASTLPGDAQGGVDLTIPVASGDAAATGAGPLTADLRCDAGTCGGVYPVRLQLSATGGGSRTQLFTYLVFADPPATTQKLHFALVVPFAAPVPAPGADGRQPTLPTSAVDRVASLLASVSAHDTPLTLVPEAATVTALGDTGRPRARAVLGTLGAVAAAPARQTISSSYVPVDATALVAGGLGSELADQVRRAAQVLAPVHAEAGTWLAGGQVDQAALSALQGLGFRRFVVPASAVAQAPGSGLTPSRPFDLAVGRTAVVPAVQTDSALATHLSAATGAGAALAAYQLLADLALVYFEQPNLAAARGVVAVAPAGWAPSPAFLDTALAALPGDPLVSPVTLDQLFAGVPGATGTARRPAGAAGESTLAARPVRAARTRLDAFAGAVGDSGLPTVHSLDDLLLRSESAGLRVGAQQRLLGAEAAALQSQLGSLSVRTDTVRLTSSAAKVPVTLLKQAPYTVSGRLEISGDKVVFPPVSQQDPGGVCHDPRVVATAGRSRFECSAVIGHSTNAVYVAMRARATGDFRLTVTFTSPTGGLVLTSSHLTVRSMSTSLVAIGLSGAAVGVLLLWWGRTLWRGRRSGRRGAHVRGAAARDAVPAS